MKRTWVRFQLEVASILHIGNGQVAKVAQSSQATEDQSSTSNLSMLMRDRNDRPWIPGSSLKGAFRSAEPALADVLFGTAHGDPGNAKAGRVLVFGAATAENTVFVLRRTKVHDGTGVAEANKLFAKEYVDVGARFDVELCIRPLRGDDLSKLTEDLLKVIGHFAHEDGLEVGSGKSDSLGRLKLVGETVEVLEETVTFDHGSVAVTRTVPIDPIQRQTSSLSLFCRGPFLVHDPTRTSGKTDEKGKPITNYIMPLVSGKSPRLLETSVSGALRKRAAWLMELGRIESKDLEVKTTSGMKTFNTLERVFGYEGYRAKLKVLVKEVCCEEKPAEFPSVKLNPLTQGPVDGALFFVVAHHGVQFELHYTSRSEFTDDERAMVDALIADIKESGIQIGFGGSKGFGWFEEIGKKRAVPDIPDQSAPVGLSTDIQSRLPDDRVTLPYRTIAVHPDKILFPQPEVKEAYENRSLHSSKLESGMCGHVDVSWLFETPMLVGASKNDKGVCGPIIMGDTHILPGSTIRGNLRAYLAALCNSRLQALPDLKPNYKQLKDVQLQKLINRLREENKDHCPVHDESYEPDFVEALFGFVHETDEYASKPALHSRMHLKSRLSFEPAFLENEGDMLKSAKEYTLVLGGPTGESNIYDAIARKVYPADTTTADRVVDRFIDRECEPTVDSATTLRFLHPRMPGGSPLNLVPLHFRGRIHFKNVTMVELGALLWAITLGGRPHARHRIGHAKAFGSGRARTGAVELELRPNQKPTTIFQAKDDFKVLLDKFEAYAKGLLDQHSWDEIAATDIPAYGKATKKSAQGEEDGIHYQTWSTIRNRGGDVVISGLEEFAEDAREKNGGRLAAALKPDQVRKGQRG